METLRLQTPYPKQIEFFKATTRYIAYGGARGGGKSWAARTKAILLAYHYPGIQILLLRRTLPELRENHIIPLQQQLYGLAEYRSQDKVFLFPQGSRIVMGYCAGETDVLQYQGQSYDVIFMEEATQFTQFQFEALTECNRSSGQCRGAFSPRMYFTCNPGGVGHGWVKRLFIDKDYRGQERMEDYTFIKSLVYDNPFLLENSPDYVRTLENLPADRKKAMLYGDWDIFEGQYFTEWDRSIHVAEPFPLPQHYRRYVTIDYGLDMLAAYWIAVDTSGKGYVYRELYEKNVVISDAIEKLRTLGEGEEIYKYLAPPDLWGRQRESGITTAEQFERKGIYLHKTSNRRVDGWLAVKEWLKPYTDEGGCLTAKLVIFPSCVNLIRTLPALQYDRKNYNDCATEPHEITHAPDAIRGFCIYRTLAAEEPQRETVPFPFRTEKGRINLGEGEKPDVF